MTKDQRTLVMMVTGLLLTLSNFWIKNEATSSILNIMGTTILMQELMQIRIFQSGSKKWRYLEIVAVIFFFINIVINLVSLAL